MSAERPIKVLVVDDNALLRFGLSESLSFVPGFEAAGTAGNAREALELYRQLKPDVVTMDYQMPDENGLECSQHILEEFPDARIILLSVFDAAEQVWNAVQIGVKGYLTKKAGEIEEVLDAIQEVASGGTYFPVQIANKLEQRKGQRGLTPRELDVLRLVVNGQGNKQIADALAISIHSVKQHVVNLREKLNAADRTQAVVEAIRRGIIQLDD